VEKRIVPKNASARFGAGGFGSFEGGALYALTLEVAIVPEGGGTAGLLALGGLGLAWVRRRFRE
jgi:hypothetical protein